MRTRRIHHREYVAVDQIVRTGAVIFTDPLGREFTIDWEDLPAVRDAINAALDHPPTNDRPESFDSLQAIEDHGNLG